VLSGGVTRGLQIGDKDYINLKCGVGILENKEENEYTRDDRTKKTLGVDVGDDEENVYDAHTPFLTGSI
jgi:hypothetical protein